MKTYIRTTLSTATLSSEDGEFKRYRKMLAAYGEFEHPNGKGKMVLNKTWADSIIDSAKNGPIPLGDIPVPLGHPKDSADLARDNKGWLIELEAGDDGLYGVYELRDAETAKAIEDGLIKDVSVAFVDKYQDKKTGKIWHDVLLHVGLVNDPYIKGMTPAQALSDDYFGAVYCCDGCDDEHKLNNKEKKPTMHTIKNDKDFDIAFAYQEDGETKNVTLKPGETKEVPADQAEAIEAVISALADKKANEAKEKELADRQAELDKQEKELADKKAEAEYETLLSDGRIVPAQKEAFIALSSLNSTKIELSDKTEKTPAQLLSDFIASMPKQIALNDEKGTGGTENKEDEVELTEDEKTLTELGVTEEDLKETKQEGDK